MAPVTVYGESGTMVFDCEVGIESGENVDISEWVSLDMRRPYAFSAGRWYMRGTMQLNGHSQRATMFVTNSGNSNGTISSTNAPAFVELNLPAGATETNALKFTDLAGFKMTGAGFVRMNGVSTSSGTLAVENGTVELGEATWLNATNVAVGGSGVLRLTKSNAFDRRKAVLSLSGAGAIDLAGGRPSAFSGGDGDGGRRRTEGSCRDLRGGRDRDHGRARDRRRNDYRHFKGFLADNPVTDRRRRFIGKDYD